MTGIYKITSPNNRVYIGQSINIENRWKYYYSLNCKKQIRLHRSFLKYGIENHIFEVIEECDVNELNERERYWQEFYNVLNEGLNCTLIETSEKLKIHSDETKLKISLSKIGKKRGKYNIKENRIIIRRSDPAKKKLREKYLEERERKKKYILDLNTGIYYKTATEASKIYNINKITLMGYLRGHSPNKTSLIYV